jgi:hypothetical protein
MADGLLYRGYIVWTYDGAEKVDGVVDSSGSALWQSRQRLEERLQDRLQELRTRVTLDKDLEARVETTLTELLV